MKKLSTLFLLMINLLFTAQPITKKDTLNLPINFTTPSTPNEKILYQIKIYYLYKK